MLDEVPSRRSDALSVGSLAANARTRRGSYQGTPQREPDWRRRDQHRLTDSKDKRPLDFVGRLENIDTDFNRVAVSLGMPPPKLLLSNTRAGWLPKPEALKATRAAQESLLTERNRELLATRYADDLELFGYSPD